MSAPHRRERGAEIGRIDRQQRADRVVVDFGAVARADVRRALRDAFLDLARGVGEEIIVHQIIFMDAEQPVDESDSKTRSVIAQIGRAACRERVCKYVEVSEVAEHYKNTTQQSS